MSIFAVIFSFFFFFFFFSSRRRHTRLQGDWSSDVCSSDLCPHKMTRWGSFPLHYVREFTGGYAIFQSQNIGIWQLQKALKMQWILLKIRVEQAALKWNSIGTPIWQLKEEFLAQYKTLQFAIMALGSTIPISIRSRHLTVNIN